SSRARFDLERQTLAVLDHPYIAKVIDGGTIQGQQPWFVMEYVEGEPLGEYLKRSPMDVKARLRLFLKICEAVRHAHQKGVIHRDIKPSNILVRQVENHTIPKVIDFGLAKWVAADDHLRPPDSGQIRVLGTLPFVCPEQLGREKNRADVRSDIYGLGMILYLLVAGRLPFGTDADSSMPSDLELIRRIREEQPPRPSKSFENRAEANLPADYRRPLWALPRTMVEDLDWIALKCLEKEPSRRYESVAELHAEVAAAMESQPVKAGPPSVGYRLRKYLRRNRVGVGAAVAVAGMVVSLAIGLVQANSAWKVARQRLDEAKNANAQLEVAQNDIQLMNDELKKALADSETARGEAQAVSTFLSDTFASPRPGQNGAGQKVADLVRESIKKLTKGFEGSQAARGKLLFTLGNTLRAFGEYEESLPPLQLSRKILEKEVPPTSQEYVSCGCQLGKSLRALERHEESKVIFEEALRRIEAAGDSGSHRYRSVLYNFGLTELKLGQNEKALAIFQRVEAIIGTRQKVDLFELALVRSNIAGIYSLSGKLDKAIPTWRQSLQDLEKELGPGYPHTIVARNTLAGVLVELNREESEKLFRENEKWIREKFSPDLPIYGIRMRQLAQGYARLGLLDDEKRIVKLLPAGKSGKSDKSIDVIGND
ncbi:MAG: protein kinase domain-containing protein, partial [Isosphaeraceae bacterium]